jgi:hypothetical protein
MPDHCPMPTPPSPAQPLRLHLHADIGVHGPAGLLMPLRGAAAGLAALAALEPGISRQRAAALLWPDDRAPRQSLRQQLLRFRRTLGQALVAGEDALHLAPGVVLVPGPPGVALLPAESSSAESGADDFAAWLARQRHAEQQARCEPLRAALQAAEAAGALDEALQHAQALAAWAGLDGLADEATQARLMRLHYLRGEADLGLDVYRRLVAALAATGDAPGADTRALADALARGRAVAAGGHAMPVLPVTLQRPPRLVGREREHAAAERAWAEGAAVLLEGEAGLGKSRLLAELTASRAGRDEATGQLAGAGRPGDSGTPYATLERLLRPLAPYPALFVDPPRPGAVATRLHTLLAERGVHTLVLDDLHFADDATLELCAGLAAERGPVQRWLFAQRPAEISPTAQALRDGLLEQGRLQCIALAPLDAGATRQLVEGLGVAGLDAAGVCDALQRHTGGNPLFVLETLKQGLLDGSLQRGALPRPGSVGALIERRLQRLSERALSLARVAAVAGVDFRIELAEEAMGLRAVELASAWDELQQAQVLRDEGFAHDLVADAVLRGLPAAVARRVHAQCAAWLQAHSGEPARVARHWQGGGRPLEAARAFAQAAVRARAAARQAEEAELHGQAAAAFGEAGAADERFEALAARVTALIGASADTAALAEARALAGHASHDLQRVRAARVLTDLLGQRGPFDEALAVGREGIALARRIGAQEELVRLCALTAGNLCKTGAADEAYTLMLPLREWVQAEADDNLRFIWHGYWAATLGHIGRLREGVAAYDTAIAAAQRTSDRPGHSMALMNQCVVLRTMGALARACEASRRGLALMSEEPGNAHHGLGRLMHARNQAETGDFAAALPALEALMPQFEAMGPPFWVWAARGTLARLWQHLGQHARALQALKDPPAEGLPTWMHAGLQWVALEVAQWREQRIDAAPVLQALALLEGDANRRTGNRVRGLRFEAPTVVLQQAAELAAAARQHELFGVLAALHVHEARAAVALGQNARAQQAAQALTELLDEGYAPEFTYLPEAWLVAAEAFEQAGEPAAARRARSAGVAWVQAQALPQVPAPFIDSFLQRNPVNRRLLALAGRPSAA